MSANLELVRSILSDLQRGDFSAAPWAHAEIEYVIADGPEASSTIGVAAMTTSWRKWLSAWEGWRVEAEAYRELDGERVLVLTRLQGRGKASGVEIGQISAKGANVFHVEFGKVTKLVAYNDRERALVDLGLEK